MIAVFDIKMGKVCDVMQNYKNPLVAKKDKPKVKTYNFTEEQLRQYQDAAQREGYAAAVISGYTAGVAAFVMLCVAVAQSELLWPVVGCAGVAGIVAWRCRG